MTSPTRPLALLFVFAAACVAEPTGEVDEPIDDAEVDLGKDDSSSSLRHYLLTHTNHPDEVDARTLSRAGGGQLRCFNGEVSDTCATWESDFVLAPSLHISGVELIDELEDHPVILRGRLVKIDDRIVLKVSAITRGITSVIPEAAPCYRLRPIAGNHNHRFELLDTATSEDNSRLYWDYVDPTPDFWGQPTPSVQRKVDDGLALARTRPVYTCGHFDRRDTGDLYWAEQLFVPRS